MIDIDLKPDDRKLRQFGFACLVGFGFVGYLVAKKLGSFAPGGSYLVPGVIWGLAAAGPLLALIWPRGLTPLYVVLTLISFPIGWVVSNVLLVVVYYGLITPVALVFRLMGRDELRLKLSGDAKSYWIDGPKEPLPLKSYYHQY